MSQEAGVLGIERLLESRTGLSLSHTPEQWRSQLLLQAMRRTGAASTAEYLLHLESDPQVFDAFVADITVPETCFFRDPEQFEFLRETVVPHLLRRHGERMLSFWSAGCATGEESYSLAIMLRELGLEARARLVGSDISVVALQRARLASYGAWSLRGAPPEMVARYFQTVGHRFQLAERVRRQVDFYPYNLADREPPMFARDGARFDVILCRNVFIYLSRNKTQEAGRRLATLLEASGWLLTGPSDPPLNLEDLCEVRSTSFGLCYQRRSGPPPAACRTAASSARRELPEDCLRSPVTAPPARPIERTTTTPTQRQRPQQVCEGPDEALDRVRSTANREGSAAAEALCRHALARTPLAAPLHYLHAVLLLDLGADPAADAALRRALYLDDDLAVAHFLLGVLASRRGDPGSAKRAFRRCHERCVRAPGNALAPLADGISNAELADAALCAAGSDATSMEPHA